MSRPEWDQAPEDDGEYGLVVPIVLAKDNGGPFDGKTLCVGMELGSLDSDLRALAAINGMATPTPRYLHTDGLPQLELIAMKHGFTFTSEAWETDSDWSWVEFGIADSDVGS